ncbi:MAG TPA: VirB8/TrbF family protein, partial [Sphingomicrobium sp.]|nr:VirB8/TrbF family protein [Sphingomicrobium sp.]
SDRSFQIKWTESEYERGNLESTSRWTAILSVVTRPPASAAVLRKNPLGLYIDAIDWSQEVDAASSAPRAARSPVPPQNIPLGSPLDPPADSSLLEPAPSTRSGK